jgi:hypothetical protein
VRRLLSALVGAALMMSMTAGAATASSSGAVTMTINTPPGSIGEGTFVASGAAPCKSGTTAPAGFAPIANDHFIVWKQFICASPSSATFVLKLDVHIPRPGAGAGSHDYGTWVVDSSSDGSLHGSGVFVGTYYGSDPSALGIVDRLVGVMRR